MKVALLLFAALGALAFAEAYRTTTLIPCPGQCPPSPRFVCAKDSHNRPYKFKNGCCLKKCACQMWLREVDFSECSRDSPGCPLRISDECGSGEDTSGRDTSDASSDTSSQSDPPSDSMEHAHLEHNSMRKKVHS